MRKIDDWEISAEELDFLERDGLKQLAERNRSCAAATTSHSSSRPTVSSLPANVPWSRSPAKPSFLSHPHLNSDKGAKITDDDDVRLADLEDLDTLV